MMSEQYPPVKWLPTVTMHHRLNKNLLENSCQSIHRNVCPATDTQRSLKAGSQYAAGAYVTIVVCGVKQAFTAFGCSLQFDWSNATQAPLE